MKKLILIILLLPSLSFAQMKREVGKYSATEYYLKYTPTNFKIKGTILMMAGSGEIGSDSASLAKLENIELGKLFKAGKEVPYVVYIPLLMTPKTNWTSDVIVRMCNIMHAYNPLIPKHVTGLSLGGIGTYLALNAVYPLNNNRPGYFKTAVPISGSIGYGSVVVEAYRTTIIKLFHGTSDTKVSVVNDQKLIPFLADRGITIQSKFYNGWDHNVWSDVYKNEYFQFLEAIDGAPEVNTTNDVIRIKITSDKPFIIE